MALTTRQLLGLNVLMNGREFCGGGFRTAGDLAERILSETNDRRERAILEGLLADGTLREMRVVRADCEAWGAGYGVFADGSDEAVVAFRGTTSGPEWYDNFVAANQPDSAHQLAARRYLERLELSGYGTVTLTGHSKGGNKAMYCAVVSDAADRCVAFDGQGFSDGFMAKYADRIPARQGIIENHSAGGDYINVLLNGVGSSEYYETFNDTDNFFLNHELAAMCDGDGEMHPGAQTAGAREFARYANSFLDALPVARRDSMLDFLGRAAALILKGDAEVAGAKDISELLHQRKYRREITWLLGYTLRLERDTGVPIDALRGILSNQRIASAFQGIGNRLLDLLEWQAKNPLATWGIASGINFLVEDEEWSYILELISDAAWLSGRIL